MSASNKNYSFQWATALVALVGIVVVLLWARPLGSGPQVVVYTSVDSEYAQTLADRFQADTGIRVVLRTDSEISKTTAMVERLREMKARPDGDVFWNSELSGTLLLAKAGVLDAYDAPARKSIPSEFKDKENIWTGFGLRARVLIYNKNKVSEEEVPTSLEALTDPKWRGRFCMARPLFGTTRSHMVALVLALGEEKGFAFLQRLKANASADSSKRWIVDGNAAVRDRVAEGTFDLGLTDTDDAYSAIKRNRPVGLRFIEQVPSMGWPGVYLIPNTVSLIKGGPNQENAKKFIDYLLLPETEAWLARQGARQIPTRPEVPVPDDAKKLSDFQPALTDRLGMVEKIEELSQRIDRLLRVE